MNKEELRQSLTAMLPAATFEEGGEWTTVLIDPASWDGLARQLRSGAGLDFDYLFCLTAVDWRTHITMVYHLVSTIHRHVMVVKVRLDRERPVVPSVSGIWRTAEFHEREAYDLMGVEFRGHPDLRRLFMTDEWTGWPLRKDYEDPVNMIKL
ncbi:MAG TPA: NADH-quinone oxidoreductase subunit C [Puia sp.]|nr:NADH-quinone oxidoreductase subunit C [Puia sp.]